MSRFSHGNEDYPEAASKHLADATVLFDAERFDGSTYLSGYVAECALKTQFLLARFPGQATDLQELERWYNILRKRFGHDLKRLVDETMTPMSARYARYASHIQNTALINDWTEQIRYRAENISLEQAKEHLSNASDAHAPVVRMRLDGILR